jgi:acetyl esterase/lipase
MTSLRARKAVAVAAALAVAAVTAAQTVRENGIVYARAGDLDLKLDLARPATPAGRAPAIVFVFGGGFTTNGRNQCSAYVDEAATRGYVAAAVDYRLTSVKDAEGRQKYRFPDQVHDVKAAVRWLRANAASYGIDSDHIGIVGWSSGANLSLMVGFTDPSNGLDGDLGNAGYSSRVQAITSLAGPCDMVLHYQTAGQFIGPYLGGTPAEMPERYRISSPLTYVTLDDPPVLAIHGTRDTLCVLRQVEILGNRMHELGLSHATVLKEGMAHAVPWNDPAMWEFFDRTLKRVR